MSSVLLFLVSWSFAVFSFVLSFQLSGIMFQKVVTFTTSRGS